MAAEAQADQSLQVRADHEERQAADPVRLQEYVEPSGEKSSQHPCDGPYPLAPKCQAQDTNCF